MTVKPPHDDNRCYTVADEGNHARPTGSPDTLTVGSQLRLDFDCPQCGVSGWVMWTKLARVMRCHACRTRFWIDTSGRLVSERQSRNVRFICPRCRHQDTLPEQLLPTAIACPACETRLELNANGLVCDHSGSRLASRLGRSRFSAHRRSQRWLWRVAIAAAMVGVVGLCWVAAGLMRHSVWLLPSPTDVALEKAVKEFTMLCHQGRIEEAARFVVPEQRMYFQRWLACWLPAIRSSKDSDPGRASITVHTLSRQPDRALLHVSVELDSRRTIGFTQQWVPGDCGWRFDAAAAFLAVAGSGD